MLAPDLLGFGSAFHGPVALEDITAEAHASRLLDAIDGPLVVAGYDVGSRVGQAMARMAPERLTGLVATPAFPAMQRYATAPEMAAAYWYQHFHRLPLSTQLLDGRRDDVHSLPDAHLVDLGQPRPDARRRVRGADRRLRASGRVHGERGVVLGEPEQGEPGGDRRAHDRALG